MTIPPPPSRTRKGPPPSAEDVPGALHASPLPTSEPAPTAKPAGPKRDTPLNFRVEEELKRRFRRAAFDLDVDQVEILEALADLHLEDPRVAEAAKARAAQRRARG